jgi:CRISPR-associated RAMP protein (TIGR02581 family)
MAQDTSLKASGTPLRSDGLRNRYVFAGKLEMRTGLHIGGGKATLSHTDSPVVLTPDGLPFIPGSSFKGSLRSTIEKIVAPFPADLGLRSCGLPSEEHEEELCPTAHQQKVASDRRQATDPKKAEDLLQKARANLCHTCQLFGSPFAAARLIVNDIYLLDNEWSGATQIRDGVAIDRESETARNSLKYDFEVVPSTTVFALRLIIENATARDLQLISIGLGEFVSGFGGIGGFRSRGLGACILTDLEIRVLDLIGSNDNSQEQKARLQRYLLRKKDGSLDGLDRIDTHMFFEQHINALFDSATPRAERE